MIRNTVTNAASTPRLASHDHSRRAGHGVCGLAQGGRLRLSHLFTLAASHFDARQNLCVLTPKGDVRHCAPVVSASTCTRFDAPTEGRNDPALCSDLLVRVSKRSRIVLGRTSAPARQKQTHGILSPQTAQRGVGGAGEVGPETGRSASIKGGVRGARVADDRRPRGESLPWLLASSHSQLPLRYSPRVFRPSKINRFLTVVSC